MSRQLKPHKTIKSRLRQTSLVSIGMFVLIILGLYVALNGVRGQIDRIVEERLQLVVDNSQSSRDFGLLHARLSVFKNTFFGNDAFLQTEGEALNGLLDNLRNRTQDPHLKDLLTQLQESFAVYLERCQWINVLLAWRSGQDSDINDLLLLLQEIIAERTIEVALDGGDVSYLEQLMQLLSGYRESLLEIAKLNAEENLTLLMHSAVSDPPPLNREVNSLSLRLRTLTASEPPIDRFGRHLISRMEYYLYLMRLYQLEMIQLGQQNAGLEQLTADILNVMQELDQETASAAVRIKAEVRNSIYATFISVLAALSLLAVAFWVTNRNLFRKHIQTPLELVSDRLRTFEQGDLTSEIRLGRQDEWNELETVFNKMLSTLAESVSALRESEKRYREIFFNATEGIFRTTVDGRFIEVNPAVVSLLGFDSADEILVHYSDLGLQLYADPQSRQQMLDILFSQEKNLNFEARMCRKNGEFFWASLSNYLIRDEQGEVRYIEGTMRDISARKAAQESLSQLKTYLQNIIDSMPSVMIGVDIDMNVTLWNKRAELESHLTAGEAQGIPLQKVCKLFNPSEYFPKLQETLQTREPTRLLKVESCCRAEDGGRRFFDILIFPLSLSGASGAVIHIDDVSERARLEEMMIRSEKMQSVGSLAAGLAHEINNPLAVIMQNVQVLSRRLSPDLGKNREAAEELGTSIEAIVAYCQVRGCEKMLQSISVAGQRAAKIVENMQSFSRRSTSAMIPCSLAELLEKTLELAGSDYDMRYQYDFRKIRIVREYDPVGDVLCESSQIQQAILSLLKNAAQAMNGYTDDPQMTLRVRSAGDSHVSLQIEDNGPGMVQEVSNRIFDPFYTTQDVGRGTGLGLSIAYFIVTQNHDGRLSVTSEQGQGSCFDLVLPAASRKNLVSL